MRKPLVAGNWKMNGSRRLTRVLIDGITDALANLPGIEVAVMPPFPYLPLAREEIGDSGLILGAQDISKAEEGAFTGEISGAMLAEWDCHFVLVGHSERRQYHRESDALVAEKFVAAQRAGLVPVLCVGETLEEREAGNTEVVVERQLDAVLDHVGIANMDKAVIAYEPVWAIGTGETATPEQAQEVHAFIRRTCAAMDDIIASRLRILYGGSVKPDNAAELFCQEDIDGGLIGGAALTVESFTGICRAALRS
ncbi:MAG: triose-phosphate isomerase [Wenzhouxiangellaceae bacterium]